MAVKTYNVSFGSTGFYNIDGNGNPSLSLIDVENGGSVHFDIDAIGHPFYIKSSLGEGSFGSYDDDVDVNGVQYGRIVFTKDVNTPDYLYYQCGNHTSMWGQIYVRSYSPDSPSAAPTFPPTTTTASPTTTTPAPTTTLPPQNPPTTPPPPAGINPRRPYWVYTPNNTPSSAYAPVLFFRWLPAVVAADSAASAPVVNNYFGSSSSSSNSFPANTVYTNTSNKYRWGSTDINAGATWDMTSPTVAINVNNQTPGQYHRMGGRVYDHFGDLGVAESGFTAGEVRAEYPDFHLPTKHKWYGINMYHATAGPKYNSNWHKSFAIRGTTPYLYEISTVVRDPNDPGGYYSAGRVTGTNGATTFPRSPFHTRYDVVNEVHTYPFTRPNAEDTDFTENLLKINGVAANPLSKGASYGPTPGLIFSRFYHYDNTKVEGPAGFINHNGLNGGGPGSVGFTYAVTSDEPIARKASGGTYSTLERVSTWSPYSGAYYLDFSNYNAYSKRLYKSSIWK